MSDKLKPREILICPVKLSFYYVNRNLRETTKWRVFQEKTLDQYWYIFFSMPLGIADDFDLH